MRKPAVAFLAAATLLAAASGSAPVAAEEHRWHGDIHRFHERDWDAWRGGHWFHGRHEGRDGWWWVIGPGWYYYPAPVYPYPDPYVPPVVGAVPPAPPAPAPAPYWYYCPNPPGYYPYVARCLVPFQRVLPQAAPVAPPPPPGG